MAMLLGGRTAEELVCGDVTTGAESDLTEATRLARRMVTRWGMGDLGLVAFQADEEHPFLGYELAQGRDYSEATAARIDQEVQRLLAERHVYAHQLLMEARESLGGREAVGEEHALREVKGPVAQCRIEMVDFGADDISLVTPWGRATKPPEKIPPLKAGFSGIDTHGEATVDDIL